MSDAALGFLQGLSGPLELWAEQQSRHRYAKNERVAAAAFIKAQDSIKSAKDISILAEVYAPDNKESFSNALTKWAGGKSALTKLLRQDQLNGGKLVFSDTPVKGGYHLFGPAWRIAPPSDALRSAERLKLDAATGIAMANSMIKQGKPVKTINDWLRFSIEEHVRTTGETIPEDELELRKFETKHLAKLLPIFHGWIKGGLTENEKALIKTGGLEKNVLGNYIKGDERTKREILDTLMPNQASNAASQLRSVQKEQTGSSMFDLSNISFGLFGDDEPASRESLALSGSEQKAVSDLLAQTKGKQFSAGNSRTIVRGFIDATPSLSGLPTDRKEDIQKLLETLLNEQKAVK